MEQIRNDSQYYCLLFLKFFLLNLFQINFIFAQIIFVGETYLIISLEINFKNSYFILTYQASLY